MADSGVELSQLDIRFRQGYPVEEANKKLKELGEELLKKPHLTEDERARIHQKIYCAKLSLANRVDGDYLAPFDPELEKEAIVKSMNAWFKERIKNTPPNEHFKIEEMYIELLLAQTMKLDHDPDPDPLSKIGDQICSIELSVPSTCSGSKSEKIPENPQYFILDPNNLLNSSNTTQTYREDECTDDECTDDEFEDKQTHRSFFFLKTSLGYID